MSVAPHEAVSAAIAAARHSGRTALVGFLTAGFPRRDRFRADLAAVAAAADVVEVGVPFSDPMADGTTIQRASFAALANGVTLPWILGEVAAVTAARGAPHLLISDINTLVPYRVERFARGGPPGGVARFIVPDLPFEERAELQRALDREGLALVQMVTPVTPPQRLERLCADARGFVYAVTMTGTTGASAEVPADVLAYMDRVRRAAPVPVCAGFGIRTREQVARFAGHVDGVVVGSALVEALERGDDPRAFLASLR